MLSDKAIQALRPDPSRPGTKHHDRDGLYLWVARSGSKTWRKDYRWQGARRTFTIGAYPAVRLAEIFEEGKLVSVVKRISTLAF
jgi:hypothetical protein